MVWQEHPYKIPLSFNPVITTTVNADDINLIDHKGVGKTTFICRQAIHYAVEQQKNVIIYFRYEGDITIFLHYSLLPALKNQKTIRYRKTSHTDVIVTNPFFGSNSSQDYEINILCRVHENWPAHSVMGPLNNGHIDSIQNIFQMDGFTALLHDSLFVDMVMVEELKILKQHDNKLPCYINHQWKYELLKKDFLQRLKNIV